MNLWNEVRDWTTIKILEAKDRWRKKAEPPTILVKEWDGKRYNMVEHTCKNDIESIIVLLDMANSRTAAQRLSKAGAIEFRRHWHMVGMEWHWWERVGLKQVMPVGEPICIKRRNSYLIKSIYIPETSWQGPNMMTFCLIDRPAGGKDYGF